MGMGAATGLTAAGSATPGKLLQTLQRGRPIRPGQVPPQGGKTAAPGTIFNPRNPKNVPMPGGKGGGIPAQGGKTAPYIDPMPRPQVPPQGGKGNTPLPSHYQSPYTSYGFDSGLQSYLDRQNYMSNNDAGVAFQYDPTTQTFTGGTMGGQYNPIPLSVMQQAAGGNRGVLSSYYQPKFRQTQQSPYYDANGRPTAVGTGGPGAPPPQVQQPAPTPIVPPPTPTAPPPGSFQAMRAGGLAALRKS